MPLPNIKWRISPAFCSTEKRDINLQLVHDHPLQSFVVPVSVTKNRESSCSSNVEFIDPLRTTVFISEPVALEDKCHLSEEKERRKELLLNLKKELTKFSTKRKLTINNLFVVKGDSFTKSDSISFARLKPRQNEKERVRLRLKQLNEELEDGAVDVSVTPQVSSGVAIEDFLNRITELKEELQRLWYEEQKVKGLSLVIQVLKLLSFSTPELFYPFKFIHVCEPLDQFGLLVHSRLVQLLDRNASDTLYSNCEESSRTARNWFQKVATIRELLPRIYIEAALLPCYDFLPKEEKFGVSKRLIAMCRGIGDPIVASYARLYVICSMLKCNKVDANVVFTAYSDSVASCQWGWSDHPIENVEFDEEDVEHGGIIAERVFSPLLSFMLMCLYPSPQDYIGPAIKLCSESKGVVKYIVLKASVISFPSSLLQPHCLRLLAILDDSLANGENPHEILSAISRIAHCDGLRNAAMETANDSRQNFFSSFSSLVQRIPAVQDYLRVVADWTEFFVTYFTISEVGFLLCEALKRLSNNTSAKSLDSKEIPLITNTSKTMSFIPQLFHLLTSLIKCVGDCEELFHLASFRGLLSAFQRESVASVGRAGSSAEMRKLLELSLNYFEGDFVDPEIIALMLSLLASLHLGMNAMTTVDEHRQMQHVINAFIRRVNFGRDFERQLEFYVECRSHFFSSDAVQEELVQHVLKLQVSTLWIVKGCHTTRTAAFERACSAFCFITIPSLSCPLSRLKLYVITGSVAMMNNCMGQGEACIKCAIEILLDICTELQESLSSGFTPEDVSSTVICLVGYLIGVPDPPESSRPLYYFRGLLNGLRALEESSKFDTTLMCSMYLAFFKAVSIVTSVNLPYHFVNVDGIDVLYGANESVRKEAEKLGSEALAVIISLISKQEKTNVQIGSMQAHFLCEMVNVILTFGDFRHADLKYSASLLYSLAFKHTSREDIKNALKIKYTKKCMQERS